MAWTLIEHQALTSSVASVTLGNGGTIPQTYKTLKLVISSRTNNSPNTTDFIRGSLNGSTANFTTRVVQGGGSGSGTSFTETNFFGESLGNATASTFASTELTFPNYTGSINKPFSIDAVGENNATGVQLNLTAGLWSNTAAITSITLAPGAGTNFVAGTTVTLYGLK